MEYNLSVRGLVREASAAETSVWTRSDIDALPDRDRRAFSLIVDDFGARSARAQGLRASVTDAHRLHDQDQKLYLCAERHDNKTWVLGGLKVGHKQLYIANGQGRLIQTKPLCVLDFYVHETCQRKGIGHHLFESMLSHEGVPPDSIAYDKPSSKLVSFLCKHYGLKQTLPQSNNFLVFDSFPFPSGVTDGRAASISQRPLTAQRPRIAAHSASGGRPAPAERMTAPAHTLAPWASESSPLQAPAVSPSVHAKQHGSPYRFLSDCGTVEGYGSDRRTALDRHGPTETKAAVAGSGPLCPGAASPSHTTSPLSNRSPYEAATSVRGAPHDHYSYVQQDEGAASVQREHGRRQPTRPPSGHASPGTQQQATTDLELQAALAPPVQAQRSSIGTHLDQLHVNTQDAPLPIGTIVTASRGLGDGTARRSDAATRQPGPPSLTKRLSSSQRAPSSRAPEQSPSKAPLPVGTVITSPNSNRDLNAWWGDSGRREAPTTSQVSDDQLPSGRQYSGYASDRGKRLERVPQRAGQAHHAPGRASSCRTHSRQQGPQSGSARQQVMHHPAHQRKVFNGASKQPNGNMTPFQGGFPVCAPKVVTYDATGVETPGWTPDWRYFAKQPMH